MITLKKIISFSIESLSFTSSKNNIGNNKNVSLDRNFMDINKINIWINVTILNGTLNKFFNSWNIHKAIIKMLFINMISLYPISKYIISKDITINKVVIFLFIIFPPNTFIIQ